jgi:hypothetical protein
MKNYNTKYISIFIATIAMLFTACEEGDNVFDDIVGAEKRGAVVRTIEITENEIQYDVPTSTLTGGGFGVTVEVQDQEDGNLLQALNVYIGYNDNTSAQGSSSVGDNEALAKTFSLADGTIGEFGLPRFTYNATAAELQSAIGVTGSDIFGGDAFTIRFEIVQTDGSTYSAADNSGTLTGSYFSSPFEYTSTLVCAPKPTTPGDWTIEMEDSYGDGWQPTTSDGGGPGLTVTLSDGTVFEIGLCTPYETPGYACTDGVSAGTATFTVPADLTGAAVWRWNGDFWGEMSAKIISPGGNTVATVGSGTPASDIAIDFCAD